MLLEYFTEKDAVKFQMISRKFYDDHLPNMIKTVPVLKGMINHMLSTRPAIDHVYKRGLVSVEKFIEKAPEWAPVRVNYRRTEYLEWRGKYGHFQYGQVWRGTTKEQGIVRKLWPGRYLSEA